MGNGKHGQRGIVVNTEGRDGAPWGMEHMGNGAHGQWGTWAVGHMGITSLITLVPLVPIAHMNFGQYLCYQLEFL